MSPLSLAWCVFGIIANALMFYGNWQMITSIKTKPKSKRKPKPKLDKKTKL